MVAGDPEDDEEYEKAHDVDDHECRFRHGKLSGAENVESGGGDEE